MIVLRTRLPLAAFILLPFVACDGTETDNPVIVIDDYESPERFAPEEEPAPPGCVPNDIDEQPMLPPRLPRSALLDGATLFGTDYRGLAAAEGDGPALVRGYIHELVQSAADGASSSPAHRRRASARSAAEPFALSSITSVLPTPTVRSGPRTRIIRKPGVYEPGPIGCGHQAPKGPPDPPEFSWDPPPWASYSARSATAGD